MLPKVRLVVCKALISGSVLFVPRQVLVLVGLVLVLILVLQGLVFVLVLVLVLV